MKIISIIKRWLQDRHKKRGLVYSAIGLTGVLYEIIFGNPPELLVIIFYLTIVGIGVVCISFLKEKA